MTLLVTLLVTLVTPKWTDPSYSQRHFVGTKRCARPGGVISFSEVLRRGQTTSFFCYTMLDDVWSIIIVYISLYLYLYGYGSIPMKIPFLGGWTSIYQLFWCELQGYYWFWHTAIYITTYLSNTSHISNFAQTWHLPFKEDTKASREKRSRARLVEWILPRCRGCALHPRQKHKTGRNSSGWWGLPTWLTVVNDG